MIAKDIKRGHIVNYSGAPCLIETINVQSPSARGAATWKDLDTGRQETAPVVEVAGALRRLLVGQ